MNKVILVGRITSIGEFRNYDSGNSTIIFTVCTTENQKKNGEWWSIPSFHKCKAWNKAAEYISKNLVKGDLVSVEGQQKVDEYEKEGIKKQFHHVSLQRISVVMKNRTGRKESEEINPDDYEATQKMFHENQDFLNDLPI